MNSDIIDTIDEILDELIGEVIELCEDDELDPNIFRDELMQARHKALKALTGIPYGNNKNRG